MTSDDHNDFDFQDDGDRDGDYENAKEWIIFILIIRDLTSALSGLKFNLGKAMPADCPEVPI